MNITFYPANSGSSVAFTETATRPGYRMTTDVSGLSFVDVEHITAAAAPGQHGLTPKEVLLGVRTVTMTIQILSTDESNQDDLIETLSEALNPIAGEGVLEVTTKDGTVYDIYAKPHLPSISTANKEYQTTLS